ncbi:MOSC domain-containing protein [Halocatena marina]|uniref:MOSC domain-containing protein n=1 Tax=Halocatena marina TaxID=2934937 RepID=A0ABD5YU17_9EURY|nr:MOSC domain-containing protein [Halocatena marina]
MGTGRVTQIHIAPDSGEPTQARQDVEAVAKRGLRGDRYFEEQGLWNFLDEDPNREVQEASDITFIEAEALAAVERDAGIEIPSGAHRRNVTTQDVPLNHLVGRTFTVGDVVCEGVQLCEPCGYMQSLVGEEGLSEALTHRGGLDASVVESGQIALDDEVRW